jgi:dipeptidase D
MTQNLVLKYFTEICKIPHVSGNEKQLSAYVVNILKQFGAIVKMDELGNVYARSLGTLDVPSVCLQAHLDMVGEKLSHIEHDFSNSPIDFYEENG